MSPSVVKKLKKYNQDASYAKGKLGPNQREELISKYAPLVKTIAGRLALRLPQHIGQDDLTSAGLTGLLDAIDKFDPEKGVEFKSYAEFRIKGAMIDELRSMDWVPRSVRKNAKKLSEAYTRVENRELRPARDEEVAEELGLEINDFYRLLDDSRGVSIFNEYEYLDQNVTFIPGEKGQANQVGLNMTPLESVSNAEVTRIIAKAIDGLPKNERTAVALYYYEELTMKEIGDVMGYTESRVSQLHTKAVIRLRNKLKEYFDR